MMDESADDFQPSLDTQSPPLFDNVDINGGGADQRMMRTNGGDGLANDTDNEIFESAVQVKEEGKRCHSRPLKAS